MAKEKTSLTASNIKYLLALYKLSSGNKGIRCVRIAELLGITKPSVHTMINTLKNMSLVKKNLYGEVFFTEEGLELAEKYSRYYHFAKGILEEYLFDEDDIRSAACAMLAEISDDSLSRICRSELHETASPNYLTKTEEPEEKCIRQA